MPSLSNNAGSTENLRIPNEHILKGMIKSSLITFAHGKRKPSEWLDGPS
jgi:hypothetical protein